MKKTNEELIREGKFEELIKNNKNYFIVVANSFNQPFYVDDLITIGHQAMITAAKKWEPNSDKPFIVYASVCIRNQMMSFLTKYARMIRIPAHQLREIGYNAPSLTSSYDAINDNGAPIYDVLEEKVASEVDESQEVNEELYEAINRLEKDIEKDYVRMYYGLAPYTKSYIYDEIGFKYGCSRQAVEQRMKRIYIKLKELMLELL